MSHVVAPFYPLSLYYKKIFKQKIQKIPVVLKNATCPHRLQGVAGCIFCDSWGSAAYEYNLGRELKDQIIEIQNQMLNQKKSLSFLCYFQAYTSSFQCLEDLEKSIFEALACSPSIKGIILGIRPDTLSDDLLRVLERINNITSLFIEVGVQSFYQEKLDFLNRGHTVEDSLKTIHLLSKFGVRTGIHLIFGLPQETIEEIQKTALQVSSLPIDSVKLHNLHVLKNTRLHTLYKNGQFHPLEREQYAEKIAVFLNHLRPHIAIDRLCAVASRHTELIAPSWNRLQLDNYQFFMDYFKSHHVQQGKYYSNELLDN